MSNLLPDDLDKILVGDPEELKVHLTLVQQDVAVPNTKVKLHCHCLNVDGNGKVSIPRLAEYMRNALTSYAIPKARIAEAKERDNKFNDTTAVTHLHSEAKGAFTDLDNSGEGGELLLYLLAERFLKIPQILCKMDLKTSKQVHYHGADGVYASVDTDGLLNLHWAESKLYNDPISAIRDCLKSLAPFLVEDESEGAKRDKDLLLLRDKADLGAPGLTLALKEYFTRSNPQSTRVRYNGIALVGFDVDFYKPDGKAVSQEIAAAVVQAIEGWSGQILNRVTVEKLVSFDIHFLLIPLPSVAHLRAEFKKALGLQ